MKKIVFDTDIGGDCDDAGALTLLNRLCDLGEAELLAVTADTSCTAAPYCAAAINLAHGRNVPVGKPAFETRYDDIYATAVREAFPTDITPVDGVRLLRKTLADSGGVTLVGVGNFGLLRAFLHSGPDEISPLTGERLVRDRAAGLVLMAGYFDRENPLYVGGARMEAECNVLSDIPAARDINDNWPGPITYSPFELGYYVMTGKAFARKFPGHPMSLAYRLSVNGGDRCSWDPTAVLYAVRGTCGCFGVKTGDVTISPDGVTDFTERAGGSRSVLTAAAPHKEIAAYIDRLLCGDTA